MICFLSLLLSCSRSLSLSTVIVFRRPLPRRRIMRSHPPVDARILVDRIFVYPRTCLCYIGCSTYLLAALDSHSPLIDSRRCARLVFALRSSCFLAAVDNVLASLGSAPQTNGLPRNRSTTKSSSTRATTSAKTARNALPGTRSPGTRAPLGSPPMGGSSRPAMGKATSSSGTGRAARS